MKELNPLQREYLQNCKLLQALNMPTDLFDELYRAQLLENKIQEAKEANEYLKSYKITNEYYEQLKPYMNNYENKN